MFASLPAGAFEGVRALPLQTSPGTNPLWAVYSYGMQNWDLKPLVSHFVALSTFDATAGAWREVARLELVSTEPDKLAPNYIYEGGVTQAFVEPTHTWLEVQGGAGAHSGTYQLLSWDGRELRMEVANFSAGPGGSSVRDLNGDGLGDVVLAASDPYIFCYACGVVKVAFIVYSWDARAAKLVEVGLQPMPAELKAHPAYAAVDRAVELAQAGLWVDALATITDARALARAEGVAPGETLEWDLALINLHWQALAEAAGNSGYPLLSYMFLGDYAAAVNQLRAYSAAELFTLGSPAIVGTAAENWLESLTAHTIESSDAAIAAMPELATAHFLRGWAGYLVDTGDPVARAHIQMATALAPDDAFYAAAHAFLDSPAPTVAPAPTATRAPTATPLPAVTRVPTQAPSGQTRWIYFAPGATSALVSGHLAAGEIDDYALRALADQVMSLAVYSAGDGVVLELSGIQDGRPLLRSMMRQTSWRTHLPATQDYSLKAVSIGGATDYTLQVTIPERIQFAPGAISAQLTGRLGAQETHDYLAWARRGQTMTVNIASPHGDVLLQIYGIEDGQPLLRTVAGATTWSGVLLGDQDYSIQAVDVGGPATYTLDITIQ